MSRIIIFLWIAAGAVALMPGCVPPSDEIKTSITLSVQDPVFRKIADFQDKQAVDSLYTFFRHEDPTYRYLAAMAFGSIGQEKAIDSLQVLLRDPIDQVRAAAAYAIGQTGAESGERPLLSAFERSDTAGRYRLANRAILEAIGKCGSEQRLADLATISTYQPSDTALLEGQVLGIYRFALRQMVLPSGTSRMLAVAADPRYPDKVRLIAANYFGRAQGLKLDAEAAQALADALPQAEGPNLRMALAIAIGKAGGDNKAQEALLKQLGQEQDYRVRCNIISALPNFPYDSVQLKVQQALKSGNIHEAVRAADYFVNRGTSQDAASYANWARDTSLPWPVKVRLYQAANKHLPVYAANQRDAINAELRRWYESSASVYEKSAVIQALAAFGWNYRYLYQNAGQSESPVIRTACIEALASISDRKDFRAFFGAGYRSVRRELLGMYLEAMQTGDPGMIFLAAKALRNKDLNFASLITSVELLETALGKLDLPKEIEAYNELKHTLAFLKNEPEPSPTIPDYNHPIDWQNLSFLKEKRQATLITQRGNITLELLPEAAPGTVANFIALSRQGFYDDKTFHRIVPNFVAQSGCPRGDGYGSLDYSIRSELPQLYYNQTGTVGMASAGKHTECTQFFITHSPTPHLDGKYTIFARVIEGMDIAHAIQLGDRIEKITFQ